MFKSTSIFTAAIAAICLTAASAQAAPINYTETFDVESPASDAINDTYPDIEGYGDEGFGGQTAHGAEDSANSAGGDNDDVWLFFQAGQFESGVRIDLGQALSAADGGTINVAFWLSEKVNNAGDDKTYTGTIKVALFDGDPNTTGTQVATTNYTPVYDTEYSDVDGDTLPTGVGLTTYGDNNSNTPNQDVDEVSLTFAGLSDTTDNLFLDIFFDDAAGDFQQGVLNNLTVVQTPEPASLALLALGGLFMMPRRRK